MTHLALDVDHAGPGFYSVFVVDTDTTAVVAKTVATTAVEALAAGEALLEEVGQVMDPHWAFQEGTDAANNGDYRTEAREKFVARYGVEHLKAWEEGFDLVEEEIESHLEEQ